MEKQELIIKLIEQDIRHNQLLNGLNSIGLTDNDTYTLDLDFIISKLMDLLEDSSLDKWFDKYHRTMLSLPYNLTPKEQQRRAKKLFEALSNLK